MLVACLLACLFTQIDLLLQVKILQIKPLCSKLSFLTILASQPAGHPVSQASMPQDAPRIKLLRQPLSIQCARLVLIPCGATPESLLLSKSASGCLLDCGIAKCLQMDYLGI